MRSLRHSGKKDICFFFFSSFLSFIITPAFLLVIPATAAARTTATFGQNAVGQPCGALANGSDFDTLIQCTSSATGTSGSLQTAPIIIGTVTAPPYADTTCDSNKAGMIQWTGTSFEGCNGSAWSSLGGTLCSDATPTAFSFVDQANIAVSTLVESDIVQVTGFSCTINISVSGNGSPSYRVCSDATCATVIQDWTTDTSTVSSSNYVQARVTSSASGGVTTNVTLTAGNTATVWDVSTVGDCSSSPAIGTVCADGSVYAGMTPDGNVPFYVTRCNAGKTWDGTACSGTAFMLSWNDGGTDYVFESVTNTNTGRANTTTLAALADADSPHVAAQYCENLTENGQSDWYLPAKSELAIIYANRAAIGNLTGWSWWSSTERNINTAHSLRDDGYWSSDGTGKTVFSGIRCARW